MIKMLKAIANGRNSLKAASLILIITLFLSNLLGVLRNYLLTRNLPVESLDVYYAAFRLPDLILNLMIVGAVSSALMPVFSGFLQKDDKKGAWHLANSVITAALVFLSIALLILFFLMPYFIHIIVPHFSPDKIDRTITIARILLLSPLLFGISYLISGILNSFQRFFTAAIAPLAYNLSIIIGAGVLAPLFPQGDERQIIYLAISVIFGAFAHMLIQVPSLKAIGYRYCPAWDIKNKSVRQVGKLMVPRTISLGANQIMFTVFTALASLTVGHVTYFTLANDIQTMPTVVFGLSFATAVFPALTTAYHENDTTKFNYYVIKTIKTVITVLIPVSVLLILLRVGIVQALLGFSLHDSIITANTLAFFVVSLVFSGSISLLARCFFAMENTITPTAISVTSSLTSILLAYLLRNMGAPGLALAFSVGSILNATLLYIIVRKKYCHFDQYELFSFLIKIVALSLIMGIIVQVTKSWISTWLDVQNTRTGLFTQVIFSAVVGISFFLAMAHLLGIKEVKSIWHRDVRS